MMINGWGDTVPPEELLAEHQQMGHTPTLVAGPRAERLLPADVDSTELREHGPGRLLASVGTRGGRHG